MARSENPEVDHSSRYCDVPIRPEGLILRSIIDHDYVSFDLTNSVARGWNGRQLSCQPVPDQLD